MNKLKKLNEERSTILQNIEELRTQSDGRAMTAEEEARWNAMLADHETKTTQINAEERYLEIEKKSIETRKSGVSTDSVDDEYRNAFSDYLQQGESGLRDNTRDVIAARAASSGLSGGLAAGVLIPKSIASTIEIALKSYGGMLEAGQIITTDKGEDLVLPTVNDTDQKATIVAQYGAATRKSPVFSSVTLKAFTYRTPTIPVSVELLQDSAFNLNEVLSGLLSDSFGRAANEHLTVGDGVNKPQGIVTAATAIVNLAASNAITVDNLMDLLKGVNSSYAKNGKFMFNTNTLYALASLKDGNGRPIWNHDLVSSLPSTILGKQYIINDDMPDIGAGNASVLFGDLSKYKIRIVKDFRIIRLNEALAEQLAIGLLGFARIDGILLDAGTHPVKKLVHAAEAPKAK